MLTVFIGRWLFLRYDVVWLFGWPDVQQRIPADDSVRETYRQSAAVFAELRDMMLSEPRLRDVSEESLSGRRPETSHRQWRSYWLEDGQWATDDTTAANRSLNLAAVLRNVDLPMSRYRQYLGLLDTLGAQRIRWDHEGMPSEELSILLVARGLVPSGESKSVVYFPNGIPLHYEVVGNTDAFTRKGKWYSLLEEGWYILHEVW